MQTIFRDGRWQVVLRVVEALAAAGFETSTDTKGVHGTYSVAVDMRETVAAERIIDAMEINGFTHNGVLA